MVKFNQNTLRALSAAFLVGYLLNILSFESFHNLVHHHHHAELHSAEAEADACHRAIYHGDVSHDCNHENHLSQTTAECGLCDVLNSRNGKFLLSSNVASAESAVGKIHFSYITEASDLSTLTNKLLRGPPLY